MIDWREYSMLNEMLNEWWFTYGKFTGDLPLGNLLVMGIDDEWW